MTLDNEKLKAISERAKEITDIINGVPKEEKPELSEDLKAFRNRAQEIIKKSDEYDCEEKQSPLLCEGLNEYKKNLEAEKITDTDLNDITYKLKSLKYNLDSIYRLNKQICADIDEIISMVQCEPNF